MQGFFYHLLDLQTWFQAPLRPDFWFGCLLTLFTIQIIEAKRNNRGLSAAFWAWLSGFCFGLAAGLL